jgi:XXXCH domain-containing protein
MERAVDRSELAEYLERLAAQIREGRFRAEGRDWEIPDQLDVKIHIKEKKGRLSGKLRWQWSTLGDYDLSARQEVSRWQDSLKTVKRRLSAIFKEVEQIVQKGDIPDAELVAQFVEVSEAFASLAEPDWEAALREYMDHLESFETAVKEQRQGALPHEVRDLRNRMKACHQEFK